MKKSIYLLPIFLLGLFFFVASCEKTEDPVETCEQDEICESKSVTVCCTDNVCVYKYNEKEYADTEESLAKLAKDLGCTAKKSPSYESDMAMIAERLVVLKAAALAKQ